MRTRKLLMVSTALATLTLSAATADAASTYASFFGGASFMPHENIRGQSFTRTTTTTAFRSKESVDTSFKTGFVLGGNVGVDWGTFRTELEVAYREHGSGSSGRTTTHFSTAVQTTNHKPGPFHLKSARSNIVPLNLRFKAYSLMANAWYDFHDLALPWGLTPYIGGGLGIAEVQIQGSINNKNIQQKDDDVFAWQIGGGASLPLDQDLSLFADYRYFAADSAGLALVPGFHGGHVKANFDSNSVLIGLRVNL